MKHKSFTWKIALIFFACSILSCTNKKENQQTENIQESTSEETQLQQTENIQESTSEETQSQHDDKDGLAYDTFKSKIEKEIQDNGNSILEFRRDYYGWGSNRDKIYVTIKKSWGDVEKTETFIQYFPSSNTWEIVDNPY